MKRVLLLLAAMVLLTTGLFASGGTEGTTATAGSGGDAAAKFKPDPSKTYKVTLTVQGGTAVPIDPSPEMVAYWNKKLNLDIKLIDIVGLGGDAGTQKLNLLITSGETPDQFQAVATTLQKYYESGVLAPLDDAVMRTYMPTVMKKIDQESDGVAFKYGKFDGTRYGLIRGFWWPARYRQPYIFRGDWLKTLGLPVPKTLADYEKVFYAFAKNDPDKNGKSDTYGLSQTMALYMHGAFGNQLGQWSEVNGQLVCDDIQPGIKDSLAYLAKWYKDGVLDPEFVTGENQGGYWAVTHKFLSGRIGATSMGAMYHWTPELPGRSAGADYQEAAKVGIYDSLVFAEPPIGPTGKQASESEGELISNSFLVYGSQMKNDPAKMGKLFEMNEAMFNGDKDTFLTVFMGIKGKHWDYAPNGFAKAMNNLVATDMQKIGAWGCFLFFQFINESKLTDGSVMTWSDERNFAVGRKETKVPSFINTPARAQYQAELNKIRDEAITAIITGNQPLAYFDEYVAKWKKSGGDDLTKELNAWYAASK
jgi:putative aldouronate transport system substrate-binding protein